MLIQRRDSAINRSSGPAEKLARQSKSKVLARGALRKLEFDVIINATPVGMSELPQKAGESPLNEKELNARYLMEMVYSPAETKLVKMARAKGIHIISGVEMFVHQGARQFEIWTGKPAPFEEMFRTVLAVLCHPHRRGGFRFRLHQRIPRRRQLHRYRGFHARALAAAGGDLGGIF